MTKRRRKKNKPEEIIAKLRDADAMLNGGRSWRSCCRLWR